MKKVNSYALLMLSFATVLSGCASAPKTNQEHQQDIAAVKQALLNADFAEALEKLQIMRLDAGNIYFSKQEITVSREEAAPLRVQPVAVLQHEVLIRYVLEVEKRVYELVSGNSESDVVAAYFANPEFRLNKIAGKGNEEVIELCQSNREYASECHIFDMPESAVVETATKAYRKNLAGTDSPDKNLTKSLSTELLQARACRFSGDLERFRQIFRMERSSARVGGIVTPSVLRKVRREGENSKRLYFELKRRYEKTSGQKLKCTGSPATN